MLPEREPYHTKEEKANAEKTFTTNAEIEIFRPLTRNQWSEKYG